MLLLVHPMQCTTTVPIHLQVIRLQRHPGSAFLYHLPLLACQLTCWSAAIVALLLVTFCPEALGVQWQLQVATFGASQASGSTTASV